MKFLKTAALVVALAGAAGIGAALAPAGHAQSASARIASPRASVVAFGGSRIGVSVTDLEAADVKGPATGVLVESVEEDSPAEKAGLRKGDVVVEFDGERVRSVRQFSRLVSETPAGRTVAAAVQRDGQRVTVNISPREDGGFRIFEGDAWRGLEELRARPMPMPRPAPAPMPPVIESFIWRGGSQLGVTTQDLSDQLAEYFGTRDGVLVTSVRENTAAARAGVKAGDVITSINGDSIGDTSDLRRRIQRIEGGGEFTLGVVRDKKSMTLKGTLDSSSTRRRGTSRTIL